MEKEKIEKWVDFHKAPHFLEDFSGIPQALFRSIYIWKFFIFNEVNACFPQEIDCYP